MIVLHSSFYFPFDFALLDGISLVIEFLSFSQRQFQFYLVFHKVQLYGNKGIPFLLHLQNQFPYLALVQQQFSVTIGVNIVYVSLIIMGDVQPRYICLVILYVPVRITHIYRSGS